MKPAQIVGVHAAAVAVVAAFGLSFLLDPCLGAGDLCLGGPVGLLALAIAAAGSVGIVIWQVAHRASPLLVWDGLFAGIAGSAVLGGVAGPTGLAAFALLLLCLWGALLAAREVVRHRLERVLAVVALATIGLIGGPLGVAVLTGLGVVALAAARALATSPGEAPGAVDALAARGADAAAVHSRPHGDDREELRPNGPQASAGRCEPRGRRDANVTREPCG